jgi:hypothetical protein
MGYLWHANGGTEVICTQALSVHLSSHSAQLGMEQVQEITHIIREGGAAEGKPFFFFCLFSQVFFCSNRKLTQSLTILKDFSLSFHFTDITLCF